MSCQVSAVKFPEPEGLCGVFDLSGLSCNISCCSRTVSWVLVARNHFYVVNEEKQEMCMIPTVCWGWGGDGGGGGVVGHFLGGFNGYPWGWH